MRLRGTWQDGSAVAVMKDLKPTAEQEEAPILSSAHELQVSRVDVLGPSDPQVRVTLVIPFLGLHTS